jgi:hypothetical protein
LVAELTRSLTLSCAMTIEGNQRTIERSTMDDVDAVMRFPSGTAWLS